MGTVNCFAHEQRDSSNWGVTVSSTGNGRASYPTLFGAYVSLLLFMIIYCARPEDWIPGLSVVPLAKISGFIALGALLLAIWSVRQRLPREVIYLILLTIQLFAAAFMSPIWAGGAFQRTVDFAKVLPIVIVTALSVRTMSRLRFLIVVQALSVAVIALVTVWKGQLLLGRLEGFLGGNYADPNDLALAITISLPLCLALLFSSRGWVWRLCWGGAMLVMMYAVLKTASRGGFIALAATMVVCVWEFGIRGRRPLLVVAAVLVGAMFWIFSSGLMKGRLAGTFNQGKDVAAAYDSAAAHEQLFWRSVQVTFQHPLFGVGPGNFATISGNWHETHNAYTSMSSEGGLPALLLYVLILWSGFKNLNVGARRAGRAPMLSLLVKGFRGALTGYVVGSIFLSVAFQFFPYFLVAYTTSLVYIASVANAKQHLARVNVSLASEFVPSTTSI